MISQRTANARRPRLFAFVAGLLVAFGLLLAAASPAHAHDELLGSDPAADSTVEELPAQLSLTFSGAIATDEGASEVAVTDAAGTSLVAEAPTAQDNVLTQPLEGEASGAVTVLWKVVSSDGHPISGEFTFTVSAPPTPTQTAAPTPTPSASEATQPTESASPSPTSAPAGDGSSTLPWIIFGVIALAVVGAVVYLLVSRSRRERARAEHRERALRDGSGPDSAPPADR